MPYTERSGARIWFETHGQGEPLVMVYGIGGSAIEWWDRFPDLLAERYRLVLLDNRGTGRSDRPGSPWTMSEMTADVLAVADELGLETFHLLGCSLGSIIVRHVVREHGPERIRSLSLLCPPNGIPATEEDLRTALFWDPAKPLIESARASWPIIHPPGWIAANEPVLVERFERTMANPTPARTFQFQLQAAQAAPDPNPAVDAAGFPVLIMHGTLDRLVPPANATLLKQQIPRARLELLEGDSHNFWAHDPDRSAAVLLDFLAAS
ncbi:alpha/beta hydrolase [Tepidiforma sp.]|uniref:alpha/beta fold hydrolase n=1 Tax=Tepidiforma sp. TaxID=2682230 RepID=UPI002ADE8644|nr:alpha/beta hydrolase [Tepidiforma sp.]